MLPLTLCEPATHAWPHTQVHRNPVHAELVISNLPKKLRSTVEHALVVCLTSEPDTPLAPVASHDLYAADFFTRWQREAAGTLSCRQILGADGHEFDKLESVLSRLADTHDFQVQVTRYQ